MFERILIANRGEIACRIIKTCRRLGIHAVAAYSDADARALHVKLADSAEYIGRAPPADSYLNIDAVLAAADKAGAQAIHPGYGFLSENADFAEACDAAGVAFVGPSPAAIRAMGDKVNARRLMAKAGVPVVPGYDGSDGRVQAIHQAVEIVGLPLMVKAAAGGGGRGMRIVRDVAELDDALEGASREAAASFGDGRLFIERLIEGGRHVEAQVFGDTHGNIVFLGERDCSVQRRHQKVIEESPSPAVDDQLRGKISAAAISAARAVSYTNAGTIEFLLAPDGNFYFLEMNTRLQVEHPVTEERYGIDLVEWQLQAASGQPLPSTPEPAGHAIEFRLYAEDPAAGFVPSPGVLTHFAAPDGARIDRGFVSGDSVTSHYDSLLAKIIVRGDDRTAAIECAQDALGATIVGGVSSNLELLRSLVTTDDFLAGEIDVTWLERQMEQGLPASVPPPALAAAALLDLATEANDPWSGGAWRPRGAEGTLSYRVAGQDYDISHRRLAKGEWELLLPGGWQRLKITESLDETRVFSLEEKMFNASISTFAVGHLVKVDGRSYLAERPQANFGGILTRGAAGKWHELTAPLPGVIVELKVGVGDLVEAGEPVALVEAMKMEHVLKASRPCIVSAIFVEEGQRVEEGALLMTFEKSD